MSDERASQRRLEPWTEDERREYRLRTARLALQYRLLERLAWVLAMLWLGEVIPL